MDADLTPPPARPPAPRDVYVGPRPFRTGEPLFGRNREAAAVTSLLIGERVVLLYSPSGAGKSSLIQAGVVPRLRPPPADARRSRYDREPFFVPAKGGSEEADAQPAVVRLNTPAPAGRPVNRYVYSALVSLEEHRPEHGPRPRRPAGELAGLVAGERALAEYVTAEFPTTFPQADGRGPEYRPTVLVFDQFEEVLTLDPTDTDEKRAFFRQLAHVMADPDRCVLIGLREDYLANLEPYLGDLRNRLDARYRLTRLSPENALLAITGPVALANAAFDAGVAEQLVDNLREVWVQEPDHSYVRKSGPYVEPVHLQVVCKSLWDAPRPDPSRITAEDLKKFGLAKGSGTGPAAGGELGSVDGVLALYYEAQVKRAALAGGVDERRIRDWFDEQLIGAAGGRRSVPRGEEEREPYRLNEAAFNVLVEAYLVRQEARGGTTWVELAHDRLIRPVGQSNAAWRGDKNNLHVVFQRDVVAWDKAGRPDSLLVGGALLAEVDDWAAKHPDRLKDIDRQFVARSREYRTARWVRVRNIGVGIGVGALVGLVGIVHEVARNQNLRERDAIERAAQDAAREVFHQLTTSQREQFDRQARLEAELDRYAGPQSDATASGKLQAVEALSDLKRATKQQLDLPLAETLLRRALQRVGATPLGKLPGPVRVLAFSRTGKYLAVAADGAPAKLFGAERGRLIPVPARTAVDATAVAFTPDDRYVLWGTRLGAIEVVPTTPGVPPPTRGAFGGHDKAPIRSIRAGGGGPDGRAWVVSVGRTGDGWLWNTGDEFKKPLDIQPDGTAPRQITAVGISEAAQRVYAGTTEGQVYAWNLTEWPPVPVKTAAAAVTAVTAVAASEDARVLALGSVRPGVQVWGLADGLPAEAVRPNNPPDGPAVTDLRFDPSGAWLAGTSRDGELFLYRKPPTGAGYAPLEGTETEFGPDQKGPYGAYALGEAEADTGRRAFLVVGYPDGALAFWDLTRPGAAPIIPPSGGSPVTAVAVSPDRTQLVVGRHDGTLTGWDLRTVLTPTAAEPRVFRGPTARVSHMAVAADGSHAAAVSQWGNRQRLTVWDVVNGHDLAVERVPSRTLPALDGKWMTTVDLRPSPAAVAAATGSAASLPVWNSPSGFVWRDAFPLPGKAQVPAESHDLPPVHGSIVAAATHPNGRLAAFLTTPRAGEWALVVGAIAPPFAFNPAIPITRPPGDPISGGTARERSGITKNPIDEALNLLSRERQAADATRALLVTFSADGGTVAAVIGGTVVTWPVDPATGRVGAQSTFSGVGADAAAVAAGGRWVAVGGRDGGVQLWSSTTKTADAGTRLPESGGWGVRSLAFSPDGNRLIAGGATGDILAWDLSRGRYPSKPVVMAGHVGEVTNLVVLPASAGRSGLRLFSAGADGTVREWTLDRGGLIARAQQLLGGRPP